MLHMDRVVKVMMVPDREIIHKDTVQKRILTLLMILLIALLKLYLLLFYCWLVMNQKSDIIIIIKTPAIIYL